jgi:hypothetical protein
VVQAGMDLADRIATALAHSPAFVREARLAEHSDSPTLGTRCGFHSGEPAVVRAALAQPTPYARGADYVARTARTLAAGGLLDPHLERLVSSLLAKRVTTFTWDHPQVSDFSFGTELACSRGRASTTLMADLHHGAPRPAFVAQWCPAPPHRGCTVAPTARRG